MCVTVLQWKCSLAISKWRKVKIRHFSPLCAFLDFQKKRKSVFSNYVPSVLADSYWTASLLATPWDRNDPVYQLFYTNIWMTNKSYFGCYIFFLALHRIPRWFPDFPCSEKYLSIPGFPGVWPPWNVSYYGCIAIIFYVVSTSIVALLVNRY